MTWDSPFCPCTNHFKFPFSYSETPAWDFPPLSWRPVALNPCLAEILLLLQQSLHTQKGEKKSHSQLSASSGSHFPWKNVAPYLSVFYGTGLGFLGKKRAFICLRFPIRQPFYCSPPSCTFFLCLICLQQVLCHFQRCRLPCVQGEKQQDSPGMQPSRAQ